MIWSIAAHTYSGIAGNWLCRRRRRMRCQGSAACGATRNTAAAERGTGTEFVPRNQMEDSALNSHVGELR